MDTVKIDWEELIFALETTETDMFGYVSDKKTGEILMTGDDLDDDTEDQKRIAAGPDNFLAIEPIGSDAGFEIMSDFVYTVDDLKAKKLLEKALQGRKPFRTFKDQLEAFPNICEQWFAFHDKAKEHAKEWLEINDIEVENSD